MDPQPSTSKAVKFSDPNYEEQLLKWYDESLSDFSDIQDECNEEFHINTIQSPKKKDGVDEGNRQEDIDEEVPTYYYGKSRFKWSSKPAVSNRGRRLQENIVVHLPGLRSSAKVLERKASPLKIWEFIFTEEICNIVLQWTNHKIIEERARYKTQNSATLKDLNKTELYEFFGFLAYTALFKSNNECIHTLFATDGTGREIIRCIMSKERFAFLLTCFGNADDRIMRRLSDPAAVISQIFDLFVQNCQDCYTIGTSVCTDEMLVGLRGRCKFKMYIPNKPDKYRLKIMCCTDARTGYFYSGYIYTGRDSDGRGLPNEDKKYKNPQIERSDFIKELALQLVTPHLQRRSSNTFISRKLRLSIFEILGKDNIENIPPTRVEKLEKRKNCSLCPYQKKRRTAYVCFDCQSPICLECAKKLCPECASSS
ncbi:hypothetical protein NQ314_001126 [Rhamnusium bicolor]|uniref:PiggyBac transposable element-derived protein domain-containing protein n=1 Tax=Rhamnusium bicolor TaxID=1586634 RepID=A0AAV8ZU44_9CUCU|nr:hypothetical protein NQ314_001126 [Rhamnusium bicolor]